MANGSKFTSANARTQCKLAKLARTGIRGVPRATARFGRLSLSSVSEFRVRCAFGNVSFREGPRQLDSFLVVLKELLRAGEVREPFQAGDGLWRLVRTALRVVHWVRVASRHAGRLRAILGAGIIARRRRVAIALLAAHAMRLPRGDTFKSGNVREEQTRVPT
eukprot:6188513-Pleurochrysis_carterae.AAC.2